MLRPGFGQTERDYFTPRHAFAVEIFGSLIDQMIELWLR